MKKDVLREMGRARCPVVQLETGAHGEIVYRQIRDFGVRFATDEEIAEGYPLERLNVVCLDRNGRSETAVLARDLRLPTDDEAMSVVTDSMTLAEVDEMLDALHRLRESEGEGETSAE